MSKGRKTVGVEAIVDQVNASLKESTCSADVRLGMCTVVEQVLMASNNYAGFRYLDATEVPSGQLPGVIRATNDIVDDSRRQYFYAG